MAARALAVEARVPVVAARALAVEARAPVAAARAPVVAARALAVEVRVLAVAAMAMGRHCSEMLRGSRWSRPSRRRCTACPSCR